MSKIIILVFEFFKQDDEELKTTIAAGSKSLLPVPIQELIKMIFDVESMKKTLVEFEVSVSWIKPFFMVLNLLIERSLAALGQLKFMDYE